MEADPPPPSHSSDVLTLMMAQRRFAVLGIWAEGATCTQRTWQCSVSGCTVSIPHGGVVDLTYVATDSEQALMPALAQQPVSIDIATGQFPFSRLACSPRNAVRISTTMLRAQLAVFWTPPTGRGRVAQTPRSLTPEASDIPLLVHATRRHDMARPCMTTVDHNHPTLAG